MAQVARRRSGRTTGRAICSGAGYWLPVDQRTHQGNVACLDRTSGRADLAGPVTPHHGPHHRHPLATRVHPIQTRGNSNHGWTAAMTQTDYQKFYLQRHRAVDRGIAWKLDFWEWLQIWQDSGHMHERGKRKGQYVMARNGDQGAYEANNVKIVPCETNNSQAWATRKAQDRVDAVGSG